MAAAACAVAIAASHSDARAGEYTVPMGVQASCANHSWSHYAMTPLFRSYDLCGSGSMVGSLSEALRTIAGIDYNWQNAASQFTAPSGTYISHLKASYDGFAMPDAGFSSVVDSETNGSWTNLDGCLASALGMTGCGHYGPGTSSTREWSFGPGTTVVGAVAICNYAQCPADAGSGQGDDWSPAWVEMHSAWVTVHEDATPSISVSGGNLPGGGWLSGTQSVQFNTTDATGISDAQLVIDGWPVADDRQSCDYTYAVPCPSINGGSLSIDTSLLPNGSHTFQVRSENAAGNWSSTTPQTFYSNNTPPGEPSNPTVEGGTGWHTTNSFRIDWTNPSDAAPITTAYYELCDAAGANCSTGHQSGTGISALTGIQVPQAGTYMLRLWLGDAAGLISGAKTPYLTLRFDSTVPGQASPLHNNGWLNAEEAKDYDQQVNPPAIQLPPSGIAGFAVSTDGSDPGDVVNAPADDTGVAHYHLIGLPEGTTTVKARAISGAGIPAADVGSTTIQVDKTPPTVSLSGNPDANAWSQKPVSVRVDASDALSGMSPSTDPDPTHGAYVESSVDGAPEQQVPGGHATVDVSADGQHTVSYEAFDVAGNGTGEQSINFKIDQTPPVAGFEPQDSGDPTKVSVIASDAMSGLADGAMIEYREVAPTSGAWHPLPTTRAGDRYYAHVAPANMPAGTYAFRAIVPDQAGNTVTTTTRADDGRADGGQPEQLDISSCKVGVVALPCNTGGPQGGSSGGGSGGGGSGGDGGGPAAPSGAPGPAGQSGANARNGYDVVDTIYQWLLGPDGRPIDAGATVATRVRAGIVTRRTAVRPRCKSSHGSRRGHRGNRCTRHSPLYGVTGLARTEKLAFGRGARIRGGIATADGRPLAGVTVLVLQRYAAIGSRWSLLRTVRTDASGGFVYAAPAGASRTIDFLYRGSSLYKHADASIGLSVPAASSIRASRSAVRNGQSVTFNGKLLGGPYPVPGKLVALEAFYRGRWRTFATARADGRGAWRYSYRFQVTHGVVVYRFRAQIREEAAYPYLLGYSKAIAVRVAG